VIQACKQKLLDTRLPIGVVGRIRGTNRSSRRRIRHVWRECRSSIIRQNSTRVNELQVLPRVRLVPLAVCGRSLAPMTHPCRRWTVWQVSLSATHVNRTPGTRPALCAARTEGRRQPYPFGFPIEQSYYPHAPWLLPLPYRRARRCFGRQRPTRSSLRFDRRAPQACPSYR
jgi:hypothetical protein